VPGPRLERGTRCPTVCTVKSTSSCRIALSAVASMITESLADLILLAPESDRSNLMAHALSAFGQIVLGKEWRARRRLQRNALRSA